MCNDEWNNANIKKLHFNLLDKILKGKVEFKESSSNGQGVIHVIIGGILHENHWFQFITGALNYLTRSVS